MGIAEAKCSSLRFAVLHEDSGERSCCYNREKKRGDILPKRKAFYKSKGVEGAEFKLFP